MMDLFHSHRQDFGKLTLDCSRARCSVERFVPSQLSHLKNCLAGHCSKVLGWNGHRSTPLGAQGYPKPQRAAEHCWSSLVLVEYRSVVSALMEH
jgi:hypothetical protein